MIWKIFVWIIAWPILIPISIIKMINRVKEHKILNAQYKELKEKNKKEKEQNK